MIEVSSDDSCIEPVKSKPFNEDVAVHKKLYSHGYKTFHLINCNVFQGTSKQVLSDEWDTSKQVSSDESDYELVKSKPSPEDKTVGVSSVVKSNYYPAPE